MKGFFWYIYRIKLCLRDLMSFIWFAMIRIKNIFVREDRNIRILVYHSIKEMPKFKDPLRITVPPKLFEKQIKYLLFSGYKIVSIDSMLDYIAGNREVTGREVVLTFDDGFSDNFDAVIDILEKNKVTATYFLVVNYIDNVNMFTGCGEGYLYSAPITMEKVSKLLSMDMSIGSHTLNHINLGSISNDKNRLYEEIKLSKGKLEDRLNAPIKYFSYPFGSKNSYNRITEGIIKESGYKAAFTNIFGPNKKGDNLFKLKRTRIDWNDTLFKFKMKLLGAYDWIDRFKAIGIEEDNA